MPNVEEERTLAARLGGCAELTDVRLFGMSGELTVPAAEAGLTYGLSTNVEYQTLGDEYAQTLVVTGNYDLVVAEADDAGDASTNHADNGAGDAERPAGKVAGVRFTLAAMYHLLEQETSPQYFSDEEFEAFAATTGQFALYPYAREFVANITGRMGLPALHLGTLRFDLEDEHEDSAKN